jgi:hypothetical protein
MLAMPIRFTGGEGAIGGDGPVADAKVKKNAGPAYAAPKPAADRPPIGLVEADARIASLEARIEALADAQAVQLARIEALEAALQAVPVSTETANGTLLTGATDDAVSSVTPDRKQYMRDMMRDRRAAKKLGITVAELRQRQAIVASPANVRLLRPVKIETEAPSIDAPTMAVRQ